MQKTYYKQYNKGFLKEYVLYIFIIILLLYIYINNKPFEDYLSKNGITKTLNTVLYTYKTQFIDTFIENMKRVTQGLPNTLEENFTTK